MNVEFLRVVLQKAGVDAVFVMNGLAAVEAYEKASFDLILMDVQMPLLDGYEATRRIRQLETDLARSASLIIGLSAMAFTKDEQAGLNAGMDGYLTKPVRVAQLIKLFQLALQKKKPA